MRSNNKKVLGAVAVAGVVALTGSAFTGTGLSTSGTAADAQFVGGTVSQSVTGATLSEIRYGFSDTTNTSATSALLTFDVNADGKPVTALLNGTVDAVCADVSGQDTDADLTDDVWTANCTFAGTSVSSIAVTVGGDSVL